MSFRQTQCCDYDKTFFHRESGYSAKYCSSYEECLNQKGAGKLLQIYCPERFNFLLDNKSEGIEAASLSWLESIELDSNRRRYTDYIRELSNKAISRFIGNYEQRLAHCLCYVAGIIFDDIHEALSTGEETSKVSLVFASRLSLILKGEEVDESIETIKLDAFSENTLQKLLRVEQMTKSFVANVSELLEPEVLKYWFSLNGPTWETWVKEQKIFASGVKAVTLQEYVNTRTWSAAISYCLVCLLNAEDIRGIPFTDPFILGPSVASSYINDVLSFYREKKEHGRIPINRVEMYMQLEKMDELEAMKRTVDDFNWHVYGLQTVFENYPEGRQKETYLKFMKYLLVIIQYHFDSISRYSWIEV